MKRTYSIKIGKMEWTAPSRREAEAARDADLLRLLGDYGNTTPTVIFGGLWVGVIFVQPDGYFGYSIYESGRPGGLTVGTWSRREAERNCRRHMAQRAYVPGHETGLAMLAPDDREGEKEHRRWLMFQDTYARAVADGHTETEARELALRA